MAAFASEPGSREPRPVVSALPGFDPSRYEPWRPALIAFLEAEGHQMANSLERLRRGDPMTEDNYRIIRGIIAAQDAMQPQLMLEAA